MSWRICTFRLGCKQASTQHICTVSERLIRFIAEGQSYLLWFSARGASNFCSVWVFVWEMYVCMYVCRIESGYMREGCRIVLRREPSSIGSRTRRCLHLGYKGMWLEWKQQKQWDFHYSTYLFGQDLKLVSSYRTYIVLLLSDFNFYEIWM